MAYHRGYEIAKLVIKYKLQRIVEIGVYEGRCLRKCLRDTEANKIIKEYWGIDPYKHLPHYLKLDKSHRSLGKRTEDFWKNLFIKTLRYTCFFPQLKIIKLTSEEATKIFTQRNYFPNGYFDLVFIDAEHTYDALKKDINLWWPLLRSGGIICGHDYHGKYGARYPGVKQAVDEIFGEENIECLPDCVWMNKERKE